MQRELFRAKEVNEDDWIISDSMEWDNDRLYLLNDNFEMVECEPSTRSVSYPNMIDKNGKKIFAGLSEYGIGGDILAYINGFGSKVEMNAGVDIDEYNGLVYADEMYVKDIEVIGIHKGE